MTDPRHTHQSLIEAALDSTDHPAAAVGALMAAAATILERTLGTRRAAELMRTQLLTAATHAEKMIEAASDARH